MAHSVSLSAELRRFGWYELVLALLGLLLSVVVFLSDYPPVVWGLGLGLMGASCLVAFCFSLIVTDRIAWPRAARRLTLAEPVEHVPTTKSQDEQAFLLLWVLSLILLLGGTVGALLLHTFGMIGAAPFIWIAVATANLDVGRRMRHVERRQHVVYYEEPVPIPLVYLVSVLSARRLFVLRQAQG